MDNIEAIFKRKSVRTYLEKPVPAELIYRLMAAYETYPRLNNTRQRLVVMPTEKVKSAMTGVVGAYGSMKNPPNYTIGISECGVNDQVGFGYVFEHFILECVKEGLGACWVGGFFKKSLLDRLVPMDENERIICVAPIGYAAKQRFAEATMRAVISANGRKAFDERFFYKKWGQGASGHLPDQTPFRKLFEAARWSPSASNLQPCHFVYDEKRIVLSVLTTLQKKYPDFVARDRAEDLNFQNVDAGIAMAHITLAAWELGITGKWTMDFDENELRDKYALIPEARIVGIFEM
jgi:nitroreductase